jgi:hypothetical protein
MRPLLLVPFFCSQHYDMPIRYVARKTGNQPAIDDAKWQSQLRRNGSFNARAAAAPCASVKPLQPAAGARMHVFESTCRLSLALAGDEFAAVDIHDDVACWQNSAPQKIATERRDCETPLMSYRIKMSAGR